MDIKNGFVDAIGNTPLIRLNSFSEETGCEILGKAEFLNPGGSVKDRAALYIIEDAEKKGYSGVAVLSKTEPKHIEYGTGIDYMDHEGRNLRVDFDGVSIMSLYLPSGTNMDRLEHKLKYMADFQQYINTLKTTCPNLVILGDYNICHQAIDIHDPVRNKNVSGFLPVEREWIGNFIESGFIDSFRHFNKEPHQYSWWSYRANARANNKGWRLDYAMVAEPLREQLQRAVILSEAKHSDHCPIVVELAI